jgi:thioredoxin reductase (NADPH)
VVARDVVVIGAGIAGLSAALECFDVQLDVLVFESAGRVAGQISEIPHDVRNVVTSAQGNAALLEAVTRSSARLADRLVLGTPVAEVDLDRGVVVAGGVRYETATVVIATGSRRRELDLAPDAALGGDVTYLLEPHFDRFAGQSVAVVGGGDSAVLDALALARGGSPVTLVHRGPALTARRDLVASVRDEPLVTELAGWGLLQLVGPDRLHAIVVAHAESGERRTLEVARLVLKLGRAPSVELVRDQVDLGRRGGIAVDAGLRTSHARALAAGDVVEGAYERIAVAMGHGSLIARSVLGRLEGCH